uniref:Arginyl aminopeptidase like 1 n=1 Tax=Kryptolebias marmoratus TaxID=37003 RepID=A0A3Q2ZYH9_KRYMA
MAELHQTPTSLCCCRKSLPVSGGRFAGDSNRPSVGPGPQDPRCPLVDVASASNFRFFQLQHFHLDLRLNFAVKEMSGWLVLDLVPVHPAVCTLVLDSHPSLLIHSIDCKVPEDRRDEPVSLTYRLDPFTEYGSSLSISLPPDAVKPGRLIQITVRYTTTDGPAIWWLDSELTCGQSRPLVFTQGHSVCNRSFFPCFDTPAVKTKRSCPVPQLHRPACFSCSSAPPSCMFQLCLSSTVLHVSAVPQCDIVFLPPSFPIVAMENPCLTFIIASILESSEFLLIDVIHEIAHGWFGNAVTNATWEEMWLSEGLATYAQRRITTEAYGEAFTCLETVVRLDALHRQLRLLGDNNPVSKLQVKFEPGVNPSTLMNLFTYEKGFCFVSYLSELCGDVQRFDGFLRVRHDEDKISTGLRDHLTFGLVVPPDVVGRGGLNSVSLSPDLVVGLGADLWSVSSSCLHSGTLGV